MKAEVIPTTRYAVKRLDPDTWDAFARLVERAQRCIRWLLVHLVPHLSRREDVHRGGQPGAEEAVVSAQYGPPEELPNIHHREEYEATLDSLPDYRITCIFVDKKHRRNGVTSASASATSAPKASAIA